MGRKARKNTTSQQSNKAVIYTRVSSKEQQEEGFSIEAQQNLLREYAEKNGLEIVEEYKDAETATAKQVGRPAFGKMISFLQAQARIENGARIILVEKTDRLHRNIKDWGTIGDLIDESNVSLHLVKEGTVLSRDSRSSEKFIYEIRSVMAKHYSDNLSEEVRKGLVTKARLGIFPSLAPLGYLNIKSPDGRKVIGIDTAHAPLIRKLFEWYASGDYSVKEVAKKARVHGLTYKSGKRISTSSVYTILCNRLYTGDVEWNGEIYPGQHEPIISLEMWEKVQNILQGKSIKKPRWGSKNFKFSRLIRCSKCGYGIVAEIKKRKYVYYHCAGETSCRGKYVREEVLEKQFSEILGKLRLDDEVLGWAREALQKSLSDQQKEHKEAIARLRAEYDNIDAKIKAVYGDKIDGVISNEFFSEKYRELAAEQSRISHDIKRYENSRTSYMGEGMRILEFIADAQNAFESYDVFGKRDLLNLVTSNLILDDGKIIASYRKPFDMLIKTSTAVAEAEATGEGITTKSEKWLGRQDSNLRITGSKPVALPLGYAPLRLRA